jgi:hypothetical protein
VFYSNKKSLSSDSGFFFRLFHAKNGKTEKLILKNNTRLENGVEGSFGERK